MGLIGLLGGGIVPHNNNIASPGGTHRLPYGTRAIDSSGGIWQYCIQNTTAAVAGDVVTIVSNSASAWISTGGLLTTAQGCAFGVLGASANTTTQDVWVGIAGPQTVHGDSSAFTAPGVSLFLSTAVGGAVSISTVGSRLDMFLMSTGTSSMLSVYIVSNRIPSPA